MSATDIESCLEHLMGDEKATVSSTACGSRDAPPMDVAAPARPGVSFESSGAGGSHAAHGDARAISRADDADDADGEFTQILKCTQCDQTRICPHGFADEFKKGKTKFTCKYAGGKSLLTKRRPRRQSFKYHALA